MSGTFALTQTGETEPLPITSQEEKELKRVFDLLSNYAQQIKLIREIDDLYALIPGAKVKADKFIGSGHLVDMMRLEQTNQLTQARIDELTAQLNDLSSTPDKKISVADVVQMIKQLGGKMGRQDIEEMVWEVDEDLDQCLSWKEFKLMFTRNIKDKTGLEPSRMVRVSRCSFLALHPRAPHQTTPHHSILTHLSTPPLNNKQYNLTQFLIYDRNENGMVSVDETMNMLYARYGRASMELKLKQLFGVDMNETGLEGGEISFSKFIEAVEKVQMRTFWESSKGRIVASTKMGRQAKEVLLAVEQGKKK